MVEVLDTHYIRATRAKGVSETRIIFNHALRNALIPVITVLGMDVAGMLGGVLFVENVFGPPGIGTLAVQSVFNLDPPVIMGTVLFSAALVVGANRVVDLLYGWIDPPLNREGKVGQGLLPTG
jgi:peptide/nickel transport system permease protein